MWEADVESVTEIYISNNDIESRVKQDVSATPKVPGLIRLPLKSKRHTRNWLVMIDSILSRWTNGNKIK